MFKFFKRKSSARPETSTFANPSEMQPGIGAFLHGRLAISILAARNVEGESGRFLGKIERVITSSTDGVDPYCSVKLGYNKILQTKVEQNTDCPNWGTYAVVDVCHDFSSLEFRIKAAKRKGPLALISKVKHLSMYSITANDIHNKKHIEGWFPLGPYQKEICAEGGDSDDSDEEPSNFGQGADDADHNLGDILLKVVYTPVAEIEDLGNFHLEKSYFPLRKAVNVTLYQDADCPPNSLPTVPFRPEYEHGRCWIDIAKAIMNSTKFVYITGWAVWPELFMVRTDYPGDKFPGSSLSLGEMLKQKADEGVTVCVMVWDEVASNAFSNGIMGTHDEEVISYFRRSKVHTLKVSRQNEKYGLFRDINDSLLYTHHQKTVVTTRMDRDSGKHRLDAFVGGLDLTDGRYDNNSHSLFRTLDSLHAPPDFWQACAANVSAESGPREPWHDIHSHVTGAAAWDVMDNFEARWKRQAPKKQVKALYSHSRSEIVQSSEEESIVDGTFNVQILRSINEASAQLNPARPGLTERESAYTDQSIHRAYVHHIRAAKHYIYIENQYFLGSSHMWNSNQRGGFASHLVAIEIAEKICAKIRANERFSVYVNIPLFPEGPPDSGAVLEILSHQRKTINLITSRITACIKETGSDTTISDWFNVFCLVNRESAEGGRGNGGTTETEKLLSRKRRFMIYIHSKFAIFDDTVAIVGSANINSRSLDGNRDTEIAIMAYQPDHVATGPNGYQPTEEPAFLPKGDVAAFRASVWAEHLGMYDEAMDDPASLSCINMIRELAQSNWEHYVSEAPESASDLPHGHLALYPYKYDATTGETSTTKVSFPDFPATALIRGQATPGIPNILTG